MYLPYRTFQMKTEPPSVEDEMAVSTERCQSACEKIGFSRLSQAMTYGIRFRALKGTAKVKTRQTPRKSGILH
jgi:hypothetical protein